MGVCRFEWKREIGSLARALAGELPLLKGERQSQFSHITRLSFEQLQKLVSDEWQRNNTDMLALAKMTPDALRLKSFRMKLRMHRVACNWHSSSVLPPSSTDALNTFPLARREKPCCVRR
ncbi:hypothetical protein ACLB1R_15130 [Escherichia coli]